MCEADIIVQNYHERRPIAAKRHRCSECRSWILPGERYIYATFIGDGGFEQYKVCNICNTAQDALDGMVDYTRAFMCVVEDCAEDLPAASDGCYQRGRQAVLKWLKQNKIEIKPMSLECSHRG